jgi:hypothetical protein
MLTHFYTMIDLTGLKQDGYTFNHNRKIERPKYINDKTK